jgi:hypothetical protein
MSVRTDAAGRFFFKDVAPGIYRLRAQRNGFVTQLYGQRGGGPGRTVQVGAGQELDRIDFRLDPAGVISGKVTEENNEPVEALDVTALRLRFLPGGRQRAVAVRSTRTDDLGNFRLPGLAPGSYYVLAGGRGDAAVITSMANAYSFAPTYYPNAPTDNDALRVQVASGVESPGVDIAVQTVATYTISGLIVDAGAGAGPASGRKRYSVGFARGGGTAMMDSAEPAFALRGVAPGDYTLIASVSEENGPTRRGFTHVKVLDSDARVAITAGQTAEVRGSVRTEDGQPFSFQGLRLSLAPETEDAPSAGGAIEENGEFALRNMAPGKYTFQLGGRESDLYLKQVRCAGADYTSTPIMLEPSQLTGDCRLVVSREVGEVSGQVTQDDKPAEGLVVALIPQNRELRTNPRQTLIAQTDEMGAYHVRGVIPGDYFAFALSPPDDAVYFDLEFAERNRESAVRLTVRPKEPLSIQLRPIRPL